MKKIFSILAAACALVACDPVSEDITNNSSITADQLKSMSTVTVDKAASGLNGNVITCSTSAPVNAKWNLGGKEFFSNYAKKKMKLGDYVITVTGLNPDGSVVTANFPISCEEITDPLTKYWIYGEDPEAQPAFSPGAWDAAEMRFSDNEGKHFPYLSDDVYWGFKTLIFEISDVEPGTNMRIMNGWWSARYDDEVDVPLDQQVKDGIWELPLTEAIAKDCARGNGGSGKDLDLMLTSGSATFKAVYYEE